MRRILLSVITLATLAGLAQANPVRFRSSDGCWDQVQFQFTITDALISVNHVVVEIPEPALNNQRNAQILVTTDLGNVSWPADWTQPNLVVYAHQAHPFYAIEKGRWFLWDAQSDYYNDAQNHLQLYSRGYWYAGEKVNVQAMIPTGLCAAQGTKTTLVR